MRALSFFIGGFLPYLVAAAFLVGMAYRVYAWLRAPQPGKMTLFPTQQGSTLREVLAEILLFPSLFRGDRVLWGFSWVFHATLALVFLGHWRVITRLPDQALLATGMSESGIDRMSSVVGGAAGIVLLATGIVLLMRRITIHRVRDISGAGDFFSLLLIIAIISTGNLMRLTAHFDLAQTREWALSLLLFSPSVPGNSTFLVHALLAQVLIAYIPCSKLLHFGGIFFTQALVKRR